MATNTDNKELPDPSSVDRAEQSVEVMLEVHQNQVSSFTSMLNCATLSVYETDDDLSSVMHSAFLTLDGGISIDTGHTSEDGRWDGILQTSHQEQNMNATSDSVELLEANTGEDSYSTAQVTDQCQNANCQGQPEFKFVKSTRKRSRLTSKWKRNLSKQAKTSGKSYQSVSGNIVKAKVPQVEVKLCSTKCRLKCDDITDDLRTSIHEAFYKLDENAKNAHLFGCITAYKPKSVCTSAERPRGWSFSYHVMMNGQRRRVCKQAMCMLHNIGRSKLRHIADQVATGQPCVNPDRRGKHLNRPHKIPDSTLAHIKDHISSFPAETSHYSRSKNGNRLYLSPILSLRKMYDEYVIVCRNTNTKPVSLNCYRTVFNEHFNLGFGCPRSDTCSVCDSSTDCVEHKQRAEDAFSAQREDRKQAEDNKIHYMTFDLQQAQPLPKLSTSKAFYLRQVWLYNLGIHAVSGKQSRGYFHIWTENEGGRGCDEVASSVLAYLDVNDISGEHLVAWSDSCAGQNKNFVLICLWQLLVLLKKFAVIDHKFPECGHTYLDSDRDFAQVEQQVRKRDSIYSVDQYHDIMSASVRKAPFHVTRMADKFFNMKELPKILGLRNVKKNTDGSKVPLRDGVKWIRTSCVGEFQYRLSYSEEEPWKTVKLGEVSDDVQQHADLSALLKPATNKPISSKKVEDIRKQMCFIPHTYQKFYTSLVGNTETATEFSTTDVTESDVEADNDKDNGSACATQLKSTRASKRKSSQSPAIESQPKKRAAASAVHLINTDSIQSTGKPKRRSARTALKKPAF